MVRDNEVRDNERRARALWGLAPVIAIGLAVALLLIGLSMAVFNENLGKAEKLRDVTVQADILSASVTAALAFDDTNLAREYVDALGANRDVEAAGVYNTCVARWWRAMPARARGRPRPISFARHFWMAIMSLSPVRWFRPERRSARSICAPYASLCSDAWPARWASASSWSWPL